MWGGEPPGGRLPSGTRALRLPNAQGLRVRSEAFLQNTRPEREHNGDELRY